MISLSRFLSTRRRSIFSNGPLVLACISLIAASIWIYPSLGPTSGGKRHPGQATASGLGSTVHLKTKTRGVLDLQSSDSPKFLLVQCHRGQFSNRLQCLKVGILLARALQRVLVLPMFTDVVPMVDVSKYVSLECLRRNSQAVTYEEFRAHMCHAVGLGTPQPVRAAAVRPSVGDNTIEEFQRGSFCEDDAVLQLETGFSLQDYRGYNCWNRREDLTNARDLGIQVAGCIHVPFDYKSQSYSLADIRRHFADRTENVMLFLDLFGVDLMPNSADLADTISEPKQMCSWMPTEAAAAAADTVMQVLIPPPQSPLTTAVTAAVAAADVAAGSLGLPAVLEATTHRTLSMGALELKHEPPPVRLRGERRYAAVHLRRADWFYYCGGGKRCFYSIAEGAAWINETLAARGLDTVYVATNADSREKMMLRRAVGARVLYWEDALAQLRSWQAEGLAARIAGELQDGDSDDGGVMDEAVEAAGKREGGLPPAWLQSLPLDDELMVQMVEKAICMQASFFVSSIGSTFSSQIRNFRKGGLEDAEWGVIVSKFPASVVPGKAEQADTPNAISDGGALDTNTAAATTAASGGTGVLILEPATYLCNTNPPKYPDERRLPDYHNPKIFLEEIMVLLEPLCRVAMQLWHRLKGGGAQVAVPEAPAAATPPPPHWRWPTLSRVLRAPLRGLEWLALVLKDGHAMAAANRFVDMYTGGAMVSWVVEGRLQVPPAALVDCVVAEAAAAGAMSLHVAMAGVPEAQQVLLMQELEGRKELQQITRMGGSEQERENTFTLLWRGDGLSRHAEPALLEELPSFLEIADLYVLAKARVLMGDSRGVLFRQAENVRRVFELSDARDGKCSPAELQALSNV